MSDAVHCTNDLQAKASCYIAPFQDFLHTRNTTR